MSVRSSTKISAASPTQVSDLVSHVDSLELLLRIIDKIVQLNSEIKKSMSSVPFVGLNKLHNQLRSSIEILGVAQTIPLVQRLIYPDHKGHYFFQRMSWQRSLGNIFLSCYSCLRTIKWIEKLEWISLENAKLMGNLTLFKLITDCSYIFYRICVIGEGLRTKTLWKVALSVGKIFVVAMTLTLSAWNIHRTLCTMGLMSLNLVLDCYTMKKRIYHD